MVNSDFVWPAHVPQRLRWDHSLASFTGHSDDPMAVLTQLFDGPDVIYAREISPHQQGWLITRHALQKEAFLDYEHFTSSAKSGLGQMLGVDWRLLPLESNPPEHSLYRQVLNPYLTPNVSLGWRRRHVQTVTHSSMNLWRRLNANLSRILLFRFQHLFFCRCWDCRWMKLSSF